MAEANLRGTPPFGKGMGETETPSSALRRQRRRKPGTARAGGARPPRLPVRVDATLVNAPRFAKATAVRSGGLFDDGCNAVLDRCGCVDGDFLGERQKFSGLLGEGLDLSARMRS